jgi:hypothetical protein
MYAPYHDCLPKGGHRSILLYTVEDGKDIGYIISDNIVGSALFTDYNGSIHWVEYIDPLLAIAVQIDRSIASYIVGYPIY